MSETSQDAVETFDALPPKPMTDAYDGRVLMFKDYVVKAERPEWAKYPFPYRTRGHALRAMKMYNEHYPQCEWRASGRDLYARAVTQ